MSPNFEEFMRAHDERMRRMVIVTNLLKANLILAFIAIALLLFRK